MPDDKEKKELSKEEKELESFDLMLKRMVKRGVIV